MTEQSHGILTNLLGVLMFVILVCLVSIGLTCGDKLLWIDALGLYSKLC